jgi:hypothetical protein
MFIVNSVFKLDPQPYFRRFWINPEMDLQRTKQLH